MENASKALIIAGAILLAILIISLGILIYNQAADITNSNSMSSLELTQFNSQFTQYNGNQRGSVVNSILNQVIASNSLEENKERPIQVVYKAGSSGTETTQISSGGTSITGTQTYSSGVTYEISCSYSTSGNNNGLVNKITITGPASST